MVIRTLSLFLLVVTYGSEIHASVDSFPEQWSQMSSFDDNEKNFRYAQFITNLNQRSVDLTLDNLDDFLPDDWISRFNSDSSILVLAGVLPYRYINSRLIFLIKHKNDQFRLFHIETETTPDIGSDLSSEFVLIDGHQWVNGMRFFNHGEEIRYIPDLELKILFHKLVATTEDTEKELLSEKIRERLKSVLEVEELHTDDFKGFDRMSTLISSNQKVKICTWNIAYFNGDNASYGLVAVLDNDQINVFELHDRHRHTKNPEREMHLPTEWFGAVYYDVIEQTVSGKIIYTLLGYNAHNAFTKIRVIDVLSFGDDGHPVFGKPIFMQGRDIKNRMVFEYSVRANMMLRFDRNERMIVMDNLSSFDPFYPDDPRYMGPDFSHNGLRFENNRWVFYDEIDLRNRQPRRRRN
ncbi:hypothetical protein [Alkalitalea saponilacus]|uniref:Uncharacterized protein n=1 Tax=Alkalitalea saponilacus TaxID=889453 RepID=A0A1T5HTE2_9BACT|nr:hypothetical protein [Alkalitalea saponilacus]ASB50212.1 hypothetical protein CDL62_14230 [Alkalitalea saponilacus]SKC23934.1 hypothetical protein SAMN03080601_03221 [Alkalitalea saponilacus]